MHEILEALFGSVRCIISLHFDILEWSRYLLSIYSGGCVIFPFPFPLSGSYYRCSRGVFSTYIQVGFLSLSNLFGAEPGIQPKTTKQESQEHKERVKFYVAFCSLTHLLSFKSSILMFYSFLFNLCRGDMYSIHWVGYSVLSLVCIRLHPSYWVIWGDISSPHFCYDILWYGGSILGFFVFI